jgi:hypothetical protein
MYKVVSRVQVPSTNEDGKQAHLLVAGKKGKMLAIPCWKIDMIEIKNNLTFDEAKQVRKEHKDSKIVKE